MSSLENRAAARTTDKSLDVSALRMLAVDALKQFGTRRAKSLQNVEHRDLGQLRVQSVVGTILEPVEEALKNAGATTINGTVGGLMDTLALDRHQLHEAVCYCHEGMEMTGERAAVTLQAQFARH